MDLRRLVGKNIRRFRRVRGMSQESLGFEARLDRTYISGIERGIRNPTVMIVGRLAKALRIAPDALFRRE
jgi:transcriptional regulator with XRE-family HTH domain